MQCLVCCVVKIRRVRPWNLPVSRYSTSGDSVCFDIVSRETRTPSAAAYCRFARRRAHWQACQVGNPEKRARRVRQFG